MLHYVLIKTIRDDEYDFWYPFCAEILSPENSLLRFEKRKGNRQPYAVRLMTNEAGEPFYEIAPTKVNGTEPHTPKLSPEIKQTVTKHQSATLVAWDDEGNEHFLPPVFGHARNSNDESPLIGVTIDAKDAIAWLISIYDKGTVGRPLDGKKADIEKKLEALLTQNVLHLSYESLIQFAKTLFPQKHNEILAGLSWNLDRSSQLTIFKDNLHSRLLAQLRAVDLKKRLEAKYPEKQIEMPPITFYNAGSTPFTIYTNEQQQADFDKVSTDPAHPLLNYVHAIQFINDEKKSMVTEMEKEKIFYFLLAKVGLDHAERFIVPKNSLPLIKEAWKKNLSRKNIIYGLIYSNRSHQLKELIEDRIQLRKVINALNKNQCEAVLHAFKDMISQWMISQWINSRSALCDFLLNINTTQKIAFFNTQKDTVLKCIKNTYDLTLLLRNATTNSKEIFINIYKDNLINWIHNINDLHNILTYLNTEQLREFCTAKKHIFLKWIQNVADFLYVFMRRDRDTWDIFNILKDDILEWICDASSLGKILFWLDKNRHDELYNAIKDKIPQWICDAHSLGEVLRAIDIKHHDELYNSLENIIPLWILKTDDLIIILRYIGDWSSKISKFFEQKNTLFRWIQNVNDLNDVLSGLRSYQNHDTPSPSIDYRGEFLTAIKDYISTWIRSVHDFQSVTRDLQKDQRTIIFNALINIIPNWDIKDISDFYKLVIYLDKEQRAIIFDVLKDKIPQWILKAKDFANVCSYLNTDQIENIFEQLKDSILNGRWVG